MAKKPKKQEAGAPAWMVTFSDMVTLLLTFFVLLLSMANMDKTKFQDAAGSLRDAFGVMNSADKTMITRPKVVEFAPISDDYTSRLYQRMLSQINQLKIDRRIQLVKDRGAVVLRVEESILFASGETEVNPDAYPVLRDVASLVQNLPLNLRIEGHTDDSPPSSQGLTNWDISIARAVSVLKFFGREDLVPLDRMSAVGYGSQRPLAKEQTPETRALNRRVEFVLESVGSNRDALPYLIDASKQTPF
jgi:chemotaxis protein MotB